MVPQALRDKVMSAKADVVAGKNKIFVGPVKDQKGEVKIADGVTAPDKDLLGMTWFVQGVVGTTE
jgi:basic membrane protein A and related proteins